MFILKIFLFFLINIKFVLIGEKKDLIFIFFLLDKKNNKYIEFKNYFDIFLFLFLNLKNNFEIFGKKKRNNIYRNNYLINFENIYKKNK